MAFNTLAADGGPLWPPRLKGCDRIDSGPAQNRQITWPDGSVEWSTGSFSSSDRGELIHVHVQRDKDSEVLLGHIRMEYNHGLRQPN